MADFQAMIASASPEIQAMLREATNLKAAEYKHRMNSIDSCSSDEGEGEEVSQLQAGGRPPAGGAAVPAEAAAPAKQARASEEAGSRAVAPVSTMVEDALPTQSLLHEMVAINRIDKISKQLAKGIDVNTPDCVGETPLYWAESAEVVDYLVDEGADVHWRNSLCECSAFYKFACQGKHKPMKALAKHLRRAGMLDTYVNEPATVTSRTPLHAAAANGFLETIRELLSLGADPMRRDAQGKAAVDLAQRRGFDEVVALLQEA